MEPYPDDSQFEDYYDFHATILMDSYFYLVERSEFDYIVVQRRCDNWLVVGFPEYEGNEHTLPYNWIAA